MTEPLTVDADRITITGRECDGSHHPESTTPCSDRCLSARSAVIVMDGEQLPIHNKPNGEPCNYMPLKAGHGQWLCTKCGNGGKTQPPERVRRLTEPDEACIEWREHRDRQGYGRKRRDGKLRRAHRLAYVDHHGLDIEDIAGQIVRHTCDNPPCVNPSHLLLGSVADNNRDKMERGRHSYVAHGGAANGRAKLTDDQVVEIRTRYAAGGVTRRQLGDEFGVTQQAIGRIIQHKAWTDTSASKPTFTLHQRCPLCTPMGKAHTDASIDLGDGWTITDVLPIYADGERIPVAWQKHVAPARGYGDWCIWENDPTASEIPSTGRRPWKITPITLPPAAAPGKFAVFAEQAAS